MFYHRLTKYRIVGVMLWSFPYLLWQAFGHWSGFLVGLILSIILTFMLRDLFYTENCLHEAMVKSIPKEEHLQ